MGEAISQGLVAEGVEQVIRFPIPTIGRIHTVDRQLLSKVIQAAQPTDTLSINVPRSKLPVPEGVIHHNWVQDPYDAGADKACEDKTWMWVCHWVDWWGGAYLPPATDYGRYFARPTEHEADVAFAGHVPMMDVVVEGEPEITSLMRALNNAARRELEGTRKFFCGLRYAETLLEHAESEVRDRLPESYRSLLILQFRSRLFRHVQRKRLLDFLIPLCEKRGWRLKLAGDQWPKRWSRLPCYRGPMQPGAELARFFQTSKVNLHLNGDTNVHSRVLECLASGSFVLSEAHVTDGWPGGLRSIFSERSAPTYEDSSDLEEKLAYYIEQDAVRAEAIDEGRARVQKDHNYTARMRALLAGARTEGAGR
jgi:hypothetical protein